MDGSILLSVLLGVGIAVANMAASFATLKRAVAQPTNQFMKIFFRGMGLRMLAVLIVVLLIFWLLPIHGLAFALAFSIGLAIGLGVEVRALSKSIGTTTKQEA